ncbi:MAG: Gfo/Idh/MocA family oxidoreductase [Candidatus Peribacteraceae bacterium]|nr:Gfo/Idh/MocA family oxidoreductase [Candidatus Peribacteraceae bacterium]MBP9850375.1 Gfo/Idh/MocA family oxidoreductase [Candidatus Peribacteraceae bacterium]
MAQKLRVGIIGTGFGEQVQLPGFLGLKDIEVIGIASSDPKRSEELKKKHKLPQSFKTPEELIESDDIDLISVATAPVDHEKYVRAALQTGKHVMCEKPFTMSSSAAKALLKEANTGGIIHATDFEFREMSALKFLVSRMMEGVTGRIVFAELRWLVGTWADPKRPWQWQCDRAQGGGILTALGVHLYNIAESMLGTLDKVMAETGTTITERKDEEGETRPVTSEDHATIDLKGKYGIPVRIVLSNVDPKGTGFSITIRGEKGVLLLESESQTYGSGLRIHEGATPDSAKVVYEDPVPASKIDPRIPLFQSLVLRLITAIREDDRTFTPSFQDGVRSQMFLEAVRASVETEGWADIGKSAQ